MVAMLSASGILLTANWNGVEGTFSMVVTGLTVLNVTAFLWLALKSFVAQELFHKLLKASNGKPASLPAA